MKTVRLTAAQAIVRFLKEQYLERDGAEHRIIHGVFGIFGHGNVAGLGQALEEAAGRDLPFYNQERAGDGSYRCCLRESPARARTFACTTSVGPGATNLVDRRGDGDDQPASRTSASGDIFSNRRPAPVLQQLEHAHSQDISVNDTLKPVSRYWDRIHRPEQLLSSLPEAMRILSDPALMARHDRFARRRSG